MGLISASRYEVSRQGKHRASRPPVVDKWEMRFGGLILRVTLLKNFFSLGEIS